MNLSNKNILVTGAGGYGIGYGAVNALSEFGANVIVNARSMEKTCQYFFME